MNNSIAIIFIYGQKNKLTSYNYQSIIDNCKGIDVYTSNQYDYEHFYYNFLDRKHISEWNKEEIWFWGCDNLFLYWYLSNPDKRYQQYMIIEHDTLVKTNIVDFFNIDEYFLSNNNGICGVKTRKYSDGNKDNFWWFKEFQNTEIIREYGTKNLASCTPLCCTTISDNAVNVVVNSIKQNPSINKVFSEIKFSTILSSETLPVKSFTDYGASHEISRYISHDEIICEGQIERTRDLSAIYHPIKSMDKIYKHFDSETVDPEQIETALLGKCYDVKKNIELAYEKGVSDIPVNNMLGGDPLPKMRKKLRIVYMKNGQKHTKFIDEDSILSIEDL